MGRWDGCIGSDLILSTSMGISEDLVRSYICPYLSMGTTLHLIWNSVVVWILDTDHVMAESMKAVFSVGQESVKALFPIKG